MRESVSAGALPGTDGGHGSRDHRRPGSGGRWFAGLDGVRGFAALLVVVFHVTGGVAPFPAWTGGSVLSRLGNWGVAIFFVLSGFLLSRSFLAADADGRAAPGLGRYLVRRAVRTIPAYWVALTGWLVWFSPVEPRPSGRQVALFYGFGQIYRRGFVDRGGGLPVAWTLAIEATFYLLLPLAMAGLVAIRGSTPRRRRRNRLAVLAAAGAASELYRWWALGSRRTGLTAFWLPSYLGWFALGIALAVLHVERDHGNPLPKSLAWLADRPALCWLLALAPVAYTAGFPAAALSLSRGMLTAIHVANPVSGALLLLPLVLGAPAWPRHLLDAGTPRWLGRISYGIYLWHFPLNVQVGRWIAQGALPGTALVRLPVVLVLSLAAAQISWSLVESPLLRRLR
ncbi:MAG: acyltransferase [Actinobacteria bacterium]|nr:acyltransferase [Actinomycetota bacterium]